MNANSIDSARDKLSGDFRSVISDIEDLLKATAGQTGEHVTGMRSRVSAQLQSMKSDLEDAERAAHQVDHYAHENPWQAVGIAAGVGFLVGLVVARK